MPPHDYPHLLFVGAVKDRVSFRPAPRFSERTQQNRDNRPEHYRHLKGRLDHYNAYWAEQREQRHRDNLPDIEGVPLWVQIDREDRDAEFLTGLGFEIVSEEDDGFILVAADDETFRISGQALENFLAERSQSGSPARLHELADSESIGERLSRILPEDVRANWDGIDDEAEITADFSISCNIGKLSDFRLQEDDETDEHYERWHQRWSERVRQAQIEIDEQKLERENEVESLISTYGGTLHECFEECKQFELPDSFTMRIGINGIGFKDFVTNYPYLFQVENIEQIQSRAVGENDVDGLPDIDVHPPSEDAPTLCVIDSGIQEEHRLLHPGILPEDSQNFLPGESPDDTADYVRRHGHGTLVAGAVLYPFGIPATGEVRLEGFIQNAKVLDRNGDIPRTLLPALYIQTVINHYYELGTRLFNHSINASVGYRMSHMSTWAAAIDKVSYERDVLIMQSAGNVAVSRIRNYLEDGVPYPNYLHHDINRIANPAHSLQALTVGSIGSHDFADASRRSIGGRNQTSAFSRSGPGIWGSIKPDVVEVGGDLLQTTTGPTLVSNHTDISPQLVQSTMHGAPAVGRNEVGTSFATPVVSNLAMRLQQELPDESALLYRALIANCARWPEWVDGTHDLHEILCRFGYGIPQPDLALGNDPFRVTLVYSSREPLGAKEAMMFRVPVPEALRDATADYKVRIDVTLSYAAMPRRTRKGHYNYVSCRLDWKCSRKGESEESFRNHLFESERGWGHDGYFDWTIRDDQHGAIGTARRNHSTLQKDWAIADGHTLPEDFLIGVIGHKGWDNANLYPAKFALVVSFEAVDSDIEIYEDVQVLVDRLRAQQQADVSISLDEFDIMDL